MAEQSISSGAVRDEASGATVIDDETSMAALDQEIVERAKACLRLAEEAENEIRLNALEDMRFAAGEQWPLEVRSDRERDGRPCLVINRIPQFVQQLTNDQRQNRPAIKVHPVSDGANEETAKVIQGLIRHIEYNSNAEVAYDTAFDSAARGGFGFWRILTDFAGPESFDQEILIKRIRNPFSVFLDPSHQEPDGSDANWAIIVDYLTKDEYKDKYPDSELAGANWESIGNQAPSWMRGGSACVAEFFYKEYQEKTIHQLATGESVSDDKLLERQLKAQAAGLDASVVRSRKTKVPVVKWVKLNALEVIEKTEWPGKFIPVVPMYGNELYIDGKKILESLVRNAKDPQRMYNYWASAETEAIALAPRTPFLVAEGQIEGYEDQWKTANRRNHAFLPYKPTTIAGQAAPPPQRQAFEPAVQAITNARMIAADDLKATTGIYDAALGAQSPDASGLAIQRRASQAQTSNFHFIDNLTRSLRHTGRILVDLIPRIYDTARTSRIVGDDGTQRVVPLNQRHVDESGKEIIYDLDAGTYDVTLDVGPSFASKRQEAATSMMELSRAYPNIMGIAGDLMVKNMDWPGAQEIAERIKLTLPPQLQGDPKAQQVPPQIQAQMQQMGQMIDALRGELSEATKVIETKKLELEHKERVEILKLQTEAEIKMAELGSKESIVLLQAKFNEMEQRLKYLQMSQPINAPNDFDPEQADGGNYAGIGHIGGTENLTGGGQSPGTPMEGNP